MDYIPHEEFTSDDSYSEELERRSKRKSTDSIVSHTTITNTTKTASECKFKSILNLFFINI